MTRISYAPRVLHFTTALRSPLPLWSVQVGAIWEQQAGKLFQYRFFALLRARPTRSSHSDADGAAISPGRWTFSKEVWTECPICRATPLPLSLLPATRGILRTAGNVANGVAGTPSVVMVPR